MPGIIPLVAGLWGNLGVLREGLEQPQRWGTQGTPRSGHLPSEKHINTVTTCMALASHTSLTSVLGGGMDGMDVQKARNSKVVAYEVKRGKGQEGTISSVYGDPESLCPSHLLKLTKRGKV